MPACPQCSKPLRELVRRCPTCQADLDLLVDYVSHLQGGLERADNLARAGELGEAVWAYLEVLETDPDNAAARKQVGRVVTAIRKFDLSTPTRRVAVGLPPREPSALGRFVPRLEVVLGAALCLVIGLAIGILIGLAVPHVAAPAVPKDPRHDQLGAPMKANEQLGGD
jgi:hypothetical protein